MKSFIAVELLKDTMYVIWPTIRTRLRWVDLEEPNLAKKTYLAAEL